MRICKAVFIGVLFLLLSTTVWAADVVKLGYFDRQAIVDRTEIGKAGAEKFRSEMKVVRERLEVQRQKIKALQDEFKKKEQVWSDDVKKRKIQEIMAMEQDLKGAIERANREFNDRQQEILEPLKEKLMKVIFRIGKEEGYSMIFDVSQGVIVYAPDSLDLTDRLIRELNEITAKEQANE